MLGRSRSAFGAHFPDTPPGSPEETISHYQHPSPLRGGSVHFATQLVSPPPTPQPPPPPPATTEPATPAADACCDRGDPSPSPPGPRAYLCRCGVFSHWNVRERPCTAAPVVGRCIDGDVLEMEEVGAAPGWLRAVDTGGWVRRGQSGSGWTQVELEEREEMREITGWSALVFFEHRGGGGRLMVARDGEDDALRIEAGEASVSVDRVLYDGRRSFLLGTHACVVVPWDAVATVAAALAPYSTVMCHTTCPHTTASELLLPPGDDGCDVLTVAGAVFKPADSFVISGEWCAGGCSPPRLRAPPGPAPTSPQPPPSGDASPGGVVSADTPFPPEAERFRRRLLSLFQFYRPSKLPSVVNTIHVSLGREEAVMRLLADKYGPEPKDGMWRTQHVFPLPPPTPYTTPAVFETMLRPGWKQVETPRGDIYYLHVGGDKQWVRPTEYLTDSTVAHVGQTRAG